MTTAPHPGPGAAGSSLELAVQCRTNRNASRGKVHAITINPDWSVDTPHDLDAERIAAAFGGYTSCLELVDSIVPAIARSMGMLTRVEPLPLQRDAERVRWIIPKVRGCRCARAKFTSAQAAARHLLSAEHLSRVHKVPTRRFAEVLEAVVAASPHLTLRNVGDATASGTLVREVGGVRDLWEAGVHPSDIAGMYAHCGPIGEPLPVNYYLGVRYGGVDLEWLEYVVARRPDPDVATWLAWTPADHPLATPATATWLELGLTRRQVEALVTEGTPVQAAYDLAHATRRTPTAAARDLAVWAAAGCRPSLTHMAILDAHGLGSTFQPSRTAVDRVEAAAGHYPDPPSRTEVGVLLALEGTCRNVESVLAAGIRSAAQLVSATAHEGKTA